MTPPGGLAFAAPWFLAALGLLPLLWWLFKVVPPAPRRVLFPAIRLLQGLKPGEEKPERVPLWLAALRLAAVALLVLGVTRPLINPGDWLPANGPLLLVIDDGWAAARNWGSRVAAMNEIIDLAERKNRPVMLLTTAPPDTGEAVRISRLLRAHEARRRIQSLAPKPWPSDHEAALDAVRKGLPSALSGASANVVWLSDGLAGEHVSKLAERLQRLGGLRVLADREPALPLLLLPPAPGGKSLVATALRAGGGGERIVTVRAFDEKGNLLNRSRARFAEGERVALADLDLPLELRNRTVRLSIENEATAGAVILLDERWRRRPVGLASTFSGDSTRPLLGDLYYLEKALFPFSEVTKGTIEELLRRPLSVIVLPDIGGIPESERDGLVAWMDGGGVVLRFAGPRLAADGGGAEPLIPVRLRRGNRALGGVMSWERPARLAAFTEDSPFSGLPVPDDVLIASQVLAEPDIDLGSKTWARLSDGTPLVTAERRGKGWLVLVHTTANTKWSNLPLSGLFVEMLLRIVALSEGAAMGVDGAQMPPFKLLDGFGRLRAPSASAVALAPGGEDGVRPGPRHPPGFYGSEAARRAVNLSPAIAGIAPLGRLPAGVERSNLSDTRETDLGPWFLAAAFGLIILETLICLCLRGLLPGAALVLIALLSAAPAARAGGPADIPAEETADEFALAATLKTRLAYVLTGDPETDESSRAGLSGLSRVINGRSAVELAEPLAVDPEIDEMLFFPLLYWPIAPGAAELTPPAIAKLNAYLGSGGTILFDIPEAQGSGTDGSGLAALRRTARGLDIPPLTPVPSGHVLTKSFYLMRDFPGRWTGGRVWVEEPGESRNDGVSPVIIGNHDWAGAWALDEEGRPLHAVVPGGEDQREQAFRFGVNLVMYVLTGNYKSDQVHVPAILERLGQ